MPKIKYYYDTETCRYERIRVTKRDVALNALLILLLMVLLGTGSFFLLDQYLESPRELLLSNEVEELKYHYGNLDEEVKMLGQVVSSLENRDENIYRTILGAEPMPRNSANTGMSRYADLQNKGLSNKELVVELHKRVDSLKYRVYAELNSQAEVAKIAQRKEELFSSIPAIQPIANRKLHALSSGYGMRIHPVYKVRKMHTGIDFSAPIGTPVYATADGVVKEAVVDLGGYGKLIEIDHGFGYVTRYAHLHGFAVHEGKRVKRGELIGYLGKTGMATAPHLHYEVMINRRYVNPVHYFFSDLNPAEYEKIIELASIENQSLGM